MKTVFLLVMLAALSGCNTFEGLGKDLKHVGDEIEKAVKSK